MKIFPTSLIILSITLLLNSCGTKNIESAIKDGAEKLNSKAIRQQLSGSTVKAIGYGQEAEIVFHENYKISAENTDHEKDTGKWTINDEDMLCMRFYQWGEKQTLCYQVYANNDKTFLFNNKGMQQYEFTITEKSTSQFNEGISYNTRTSVQPETTAAAPSSDKDMLESSKYTFTKKTAEDVDFFVRQTAQNCPGCNLAKSNLSGQILIGANLEGANLTETDLSDTVLRRANLKGANLYKANLRGANLMGANLTGANLTEADLTDTSTQGAIGLMPNN